MILDIKSSKFSEGMLSQFHTQIPLLAAGDCIEE